MKKKMFFLVLSVLTVGLLNTCTKDTSLSSSVTGRRVGGSMYENISTINQQIEAINVSIADLDNIRVNIQTLIEAKESQGEDIMVLRNEITALHADDKALEEIIAALKEDNKSLWEEIATLLEGDKTLEDKIIALQDKYDALLAEIEILKTADKTLESKISELKNYVDNELKKYATTEWVNATFATLAQQENILADIAAIKQDIAALDTKLGQSVTELSQSITELGQSITEIDQSIIELYQSITDLELSLKTWVNTQLCAYYTAAQMDVKIQALQNQIDTLKTNSKANKDRIDALEENLASLTQELENAKDTLRSEYKAAIREAIEEYDGQITQRIQQKINDVNTRIDTLTGRVESLEATVASLLADVAALKGMIQSVTIIPAYSDGSVEIYGMALTVNCIVDPADAVEGLTKDSVTVFISKAKTKATNHEVIAVSELTKDAASGEVSIKADVSSFLPTSGQSLMAALRFRNGLSQYTTEFYPAYLGDNVDVTTGDDGNRVVTVKSDTTISHVGGGKISIAEFYEQSKSTTIQIQGIGTVTFDKAAAKKIKENAEAAGATEIFIKVENVTTTKPVPNADVVFEVTMKAVNDDGTEVYREGVQDGVATIEIPLDDDVAYVKTVTLVNDDGDPIDGGVIPDSEKFEDGVLSFSVNHFSKYAVDYVRKSEIIGVTGVSLNKDKLNLAVGGNETLIATVTPENATNKNVTWSSSNTAVATVDANGKVTAVSVGTTTVTVTTKDGGKTATCAVTVTIPVTGVSLNKTELTLPAGSTETLIATVTPDNATNKNVTWSSSNPAVATVDSNGKVTAVSAGTATITVTTVDGGKTATCAVTVTIPVTGVSLNKTELTLPAGSTETLIATITPADATNKNVTWSSSNTAVATVGNDGKVTAVSAGTATITVTTEDGGKTATCAVTVTIPVTGVSLNKTELTLPAGGTETLIATVTPDDATDKSVTWSSSNPAVATVGNDGKVTAVSVGTATITVTTVDGGKTATCAVTVTNPIVNVISVSLNKTSLTLAAGSTEILIATVTPDNATNKNVTWSSDNEAVATVGNDGKVTAVTRGTATITVTTVDGGKTATCAVTVNPRGDTDPYGHENW